MMPWYEATALMVGGLLFLMMFGLPVAIAFLTINVIGVYIFMGGLIGVDQLVANATTSVTSFALVPVPLFLIMGELLFHTGLAFRVFDALDKCLGGIRGRLSYLTVGGGTILLPTASADAASKSRSNSLTETDGGGHWRKLTLLCTPPSLLFAGESLSIDQDYSCNHHLYIY